MASLEACREDYSHRESLPWLDQERGKKNEGERGFLESKLL